VWPEGVWRMKQSLGQGLVGNTLPFAKELFGKGGFGAQRLRRIAGGEDGGCRCPGAAKLCHHPLRRLREPRRQPPIECRFLSQGEFAQPDIEGAIKGSSRRWFDERVADQVEAGWI